MKDLKQELEERGLLYQLSSEELFEKFDKWEWIFYCGFDPTADSLHLWNFIGFMVWIHLMRRWNKFVALTGWATGMIWDPGWKDAERSFLSKEDLENNSKKIFSQIKSIFSNLKKFTKEDYNYDFVNNMDFYKDLSYLDFLRNVWKYITVNVMMSKDTVKKRIEDKDKSISYTEFSYMLLQGYDFCRLYEDLWATLQIWWQDQWWNLITWTELIRKKYSWDSYVLTWPLITDSSWKKFWKSEWNAIWLDEDKTSSYQVYQYFMNSDDKDLERYFKMLTLLSIDEISAILKDHEKNPEERIWQKQLSYKVVEIIHGRKQANLAEKISDFMFWDGDKLEIINSLDSQELDIFRKSMWWIFYSGQNLFEIIVSSWLANSNWEARNALQSWAIFINENKVTDTKYDFSNDFINNKILLLRKWKKNFRLIIKK